MRRRSYTMVRCAVALFATGLVDAHPITFDSTISYSGAQPSGGPASISNWNGASFDAANIGGSGINADGGADNGVANDATTYVAGNQPVQGQTFTTGSNSNGYDLTAVTARMAGYTNNTATGSNRVNWDLTTKNGPVQVEIGKVSGTSFTTFTKQLFIMGGEGNPGSGTSASGAGTYITFNLPFSTHLEPNTTYALDFWIGNGSTNFFEWLGTSADPYSGGTAYNRSGATITPLAGDRVFQLDLTASASPPPVFAHPGTLHTQTDLDRMAAKVTANAEPWKTDFDILANSPWAQTSWPAYDVDYINRGGANPNNYTRSQQDAQAIYELALRWKLTGDTAYADHAVQIANVWSGLLGVTGDSNQSLAAGICGYLFATGGELLSTYPGWPEGEKQAYKNMMMRVFYSSNLDFLWRHHDTPFTKGGNTHYRLNWDTANMASMAAIGILCDNRAVFEQAVGFFKFGPGNGRVERAAWLLHPGGLGQGEEAGRDQGHNLGGWYCMGLLCQMAWNQGEDLFSYDNNRVLRVFEYNAKYNLGNDDVPYTRHRNCDLGYTEGSVSGAGRGLGGYYVNELVYNHYANVKGIAAPWCELAVGATRPEPRPDPGIHPSQVDWLGLGSLTFARDALTTDHPPTGLHAYWRKNQVVLDWWGSARATSYVVKRATDVGGSYTTLGTVIGADLNFTDSSVENATTYYYVVTANTPSGDLDSVPLRVARELVTHFTFEGNADDVVGTRDAVPMGNTAPGFTTGFGGGQAISFDGATQYAQLPVGSGNYQDITIAAWVRWGGGAAWQRIFDFGGEIEKYMFLTPSTGSNVRFQITSTRNNDGSCTLDGPVLPVNQWVHVAVTLNSDTATLFVNGVPADAEVMDLVDPLFGQPFCYIGRSMWNNDPYFNGRIDDFRIYNHALSGNEVYDLWGQSANNPPGFTSDPIRPVDASEDADYGVSGETLASHASDANGGTLVFSKVTGPAWLTVAADGSLSGTPTNADIGDNLFVVRVTDPSGATDDANLHISVNNTNDAPVWSGNPVDGGTITSGEEFSFAAASHASDVDSGDTLTFSKVDGPSWLSAAPDGTLSGAPGPGDVGANIFTLRVSDAASASSDTSFTVQVLSSSLLRSHYLFENNAIDSESDYDGVVTGSPAYATGQSGQAIVLNGTDSFVTLPAGVANYENITIATWVYWNGGSNWQRIFDFGNGTSQYLNLTANSGSGMRFAIKNGGSEQSVATAALPAGQWVHVAVTLGGNTATLFVNGFPIASNTAVSISPRDFNPAVNYIGKSQYADPLFSGMIDDFRIYNHALSGNEVASLAGVPMPAYGTVAYWDFQEGAANAYVPGPAANGTYNGSILDLSGNGNHLSPWSATTFYYRATVPVGTTPQTGSANSLSLQNAGSFPSASTVGTRVNGWSPAKWTIEATIRPNSVTGNQTFVGRDSQNYAGTGGASVLYFSTRGSALAIQFTDVAGNIRNLQTASGVVTAGQWQAVAATSDGSTLSLYRKNLTAGDPSYSLLGTMDISSSVNPALAIGAGDGGDWDVGEFSVGRGLYNGGHVDRFLGYLDDIRLSNVALDVGEFLYSNPPAAPAIPTGLAATAISARQVFLSWTPVAGATTYTVKRSPASGGSHTVIATGVTDPTFVDWDVSGGSTYFYVVAGVNSGGVGADSEEASATTVPAAPTDLVASAVSVSGIDLSWSGSTGADSYIVKRSTSSGGTFNTVATGLTATSFSDTRLTFGTPCFYVVVAVNAAGESVQSAEATTTRPGPVAYWNFEEGTADTYVPYAPGAAGQYDGSILDVSGHGNNLSAWAANWEWYRADVPAATTPQTQAANSISLQNANNYNAMSAIGTSLTTWSPAQWTIEAAIRPDDATLGTTQTIVGRDSQGAYAGNPALPALSFSVRPAGSLAIQFTDVAGNNWDLESAANVISDAKWQAVAASFDGDTLTIYLKNLSDGSPTYTLLGSLDISGSANPALSTGAGDGADWDAGVISVGRGLNAGLHTDRFVGYLDDIRLSDVALAPDQLLYGIAPPVPAGLSATAVSTSGIDLVWSASGGATSYNVKRSTDTGGPFIPIATGVATLGFSDTGLAENSSYFYVVSAVNAAGESNDSDLANASTLSALITADEIRSSILAFSNISANSADLTMTVAGSVVGHTYQVQHSPDLEPGSWETVGDLHAGTGGELRIVVQLTLDGQRGFYRISISR